MTTENAVVEQTQEQQAAADAAADAEFAAGFDGAEVQADDAPEEVKDEAPPAESATPAPAEAPKEPTLTDVMAALTQLDGRQRKIEGKFGEVNGSVKALQEASQATRAATTQGQDAPTERQVAAAASAAATGDFKKLDALVEDFPDVGAALIELRDHFSNVTKQIPRVDETAIANRAAEIAAQRAGATGNELVAKARALARIDLAHDGWEETVNTPEFDAWFKTQPAEMQALASSDKPKDSIKLLDSYAASRKAADEAAQRAQQGQQSKTRRLAAAVPVQGSGKAGGPTTLSDDDAFEMGFNS